MPCKRTKPDPSYIACDCNQHTMVVVNFRDRIQPAAFEIHYDSMHKNEVDPMHGGPGLTPEEVNSDRTVYLIAEDAADTPETLEKWIKANLDVLFECELEGWYTDPAVWPNNRTYALFKTWFEVECHTVLLDTLGGLIVDDDE